MAARVCKIGRGGAIESSSGIRKGRWRGATGPEPTSKRNRRGDRPAFVKTRRSEQGLGAAPRLTPARSDVDVDVTSHIHVLPQSPPMLARASDQGFCEIAAIGAELRRS